MRYEVIKSSPNNPWVLFIHGLGGSMRMWESNCNDFTDKFNILLVDLQGHGTSPFSLEDKKKPHERACFLIKNILDSENIPKVNIVALSLGTVTAMNFMKEYPDMVDGMVLGGAVMRLPLLSQILYSIAEIGKHFLPVRVIYPFFAHIVMPTERHEKSRKIFIRESKKLVKSAFKAWVHALVPKKKFLRSFADIVNNYGKRVLFISGSEDYLFLKGIKNAGESIDNFNLEILEGIGHVCTIEDRENFDRLAMSFLI